MLALHAQGLGSISSTAKEKEECKEGYTSNYCHMYI
jgi:hypothetical protein